MRLSKDLVERIVCSYLEGQTDHINYIEINETDSLGNDLNGVDDGQEQWIRLTVDHADYFSEDLLVDGGGTTCLQWIDRTDTGRDTSMEDEARSRGLTAL